MSDQFAGLRRSPVPDVEEIVLWQAPESAGLWDLTDGYTSERPPPFWSFAWAGGRILARYVLDHPAEFAGRRVLDVGSGSGLVAIAAAKVGATPVHAVDSSAPAVAAIAVNALANDVGVVARVGTQFDMGGGDELILAGDMFYSGDLSGRLRAALRRAAGRGARVLVGDADRGYLPRALFRELATATLRVPVAVEGTGSVTATVWELSAPPATSRS